MKRYQELLSNYCEKHGSTNAARRIGVAKQSMSNYLHDGTEPRAANLEKMAAFFKESVASLLMEVGESDSVDNQIIDILKQLNKTQKKAVLRYLKGLL